MPPDISDKMCLCLSELAQPEQLPMRRRLLRSLFGQRVWAYPELQCTLYTIQGTQINRIASQSHCIEYNVSGMIMTITAAQNGYHSFKLAIIALKKLHLLSGIVKNAHFQAFWAAFINGWKNVAHRKSRKKKRSWLFQVSVASLRLPYTELNGFFRAVLLHGH